MNISRALTILLNIMLSYSLIRPEFSRMYRRIIEEKKNFTMKMQMPFQTPKIIVSIIDKNDNRYNNRNDRDNTTSVRININPSPDLTDSSERAHMIAMLFI